MSEGVEITAPLLNAKPLPTAFSQTMLLNFGGTPFHINLRIPGSRVAVFQSGMIRCSQIVVYCSTARSRASRRSCFNFLFLSARGISVLIAYN